MSEDIAYVLKKAGHRADVVTSFIEAANADGLILFIPFTPYFFALNAPFYVTFKGPKLFYTTADGVPKRTLFNQFLLSKISVIANSTATALNLQAAGINVDKIIGHGINFEKVKQAEELVPALKKKLDEDFPDTFRIAVVTGESKRKNTDLLYDTAKYLQDHNINAHFFVIARPSFQKYILDRGVLNNLHIVSDFGARRHIDVLALYGACDLTVIFSGAEGFGLPLIESMAMGTPVAHLNIPPLAELSSWEYNFIVQPRSYVQYFDPNSGQTWNIARAEAEDFAKAILLAMSTQDMDERRKKVKEYARAFDAEKIYQEFIFL